MPKLSTTEISARMTTALHVVHSLYGELSSFLELVRDSLLRSELDIKITRNKRFVVRDPSNKARTVTSACMALDLGFIGELDADDSEDVDLADAADEGEDAASETKGYKIRDGARFLVFHIRLLDEGNSPGGQDGPTCYVALVEHLVHEARGKRSRGGAAATTFQAQRRFFLRLIRLVDDTTGKDAEIVQKIPRYRLRASVSRIRSYPLAKFGNEASVNGLIDDIVEMCRAE